MNDVPIKIQNVYRSFGWGPVLRDLSLSVAPGSIYGFLGRNGSGKTTTLRMLAGLIQPDTGTLSVMGHDPFRMGAAERQWVGYMSESAAIPPMTSVRGVLRLGRDLYPSWDQALADNLATRYNLAPKKKFMTLSQGSQRLLSFIMAIAPRPRVLLLDEPAANLDVVARREILDDILGLIRETGSTVLFSTHILSDVERVADRVGILAHGRLQIDEPLDTLKDSVRQARFYNFPGALPTEEVPGSFRTVRTAKEITVTLREPTPGAIEHLAGRWGCEVETRSLSLEDIFVEISRSKGEAL
jgi:ABC-2 type transport system ATP-binding protein